MGPPDQNRAARPDDEALAQRLKRFVQDFVHLAKGQIPGFVWKENGPGVALLALPPQWDPQGRFGEPRPVALAPAPGAVSGEEQLPDLLTPGTYVWECLLDAARHMGARADLTLFHLVDWDQLPPSWQQQVPGITVRRGILEVESLRLVQHPLLLLTFQVTWKTDQILQQTYSILCDPWMEVCHLATDEEWAWIRRAAGVPEIAVASPGRRPRRGKTRRKVCRSSRGSPASQEKALKAANYPVYQMYREATRLLESQLAGVTEETFAAARTRLSDEERKLAEYYECRRQESLEELRRVVRRVASLAVRMELARQPHVRERLAAELTRARREQEKAEKAYAASYRQQQAELARYVAELRRSFAFQVEARLVQAARVFWPRVEYNLRLANGSRSSAVTCYYDLLRHQVAALNCHSCGRPLREVFVTDEGTPACPECVFLCAHCGTPSLAPPERRICHVCGESFCERCRSTCPAAFPPAPVPDPSPAGSAGSAGTLPRTQTSIRRRSWPLRPHLGPVDAAAVQICPRCRQQWCPTCQAVISS
ncbi:MAG: hypothetical protein IMW99_01215 [Firmicutes bacterium]|nr:hypothetical protein [Bacillota bacterium]